MYQCELRFAKLTWSGKFATVLDKASAVALLSLFVVVMFLTIPDIFATVTYLYDQYFYFRTWRNGTEIAR
jgi:hypothetical protein